MVAGRRRKEAHTADHRAALFVGSAEIEPADAGEGNRRRAHGAGFERHVEVGVAEALCRKRRGGIADRQHLGMRGRVVEFAGAVACLRDHRFAERDDRADRHFATRRGGFRLRKRDLHEIRPLHGLRIATFLLAPPDDAGIYPRRKANATWPTTTTTNATRKPGSRPGGARPFAKRGEGKPGFGAKPYAPRRQEAICKTPRRGSRCRRRAAQARLQGVGRRQAGRLQGRRSAQSPSRSAADGDSTQLRRTPGAQPS